MNSLTTRDADLIWHPFTQEKTAPRPLGIVRGEGAYLFDESGYRYLDLISSWWVNLHGHSHPALVAALTTQAKILDHVLFAGMTHPPAVELAEQLSHCLPQTLTRFFYSDNGSTATEIALKLALQYWHLQEQPQRRLFLTLEGGYHGDTFGAMSVGISSGYHDAFKALCFEVLTLPYPETWLDDPTVLEKEAQLFDQLEAYLQIYADTIAAIILEPMVQGASGMRMCRAACIQQLVERIQAAGILVIFDEVMTGFGRTGSLFALEQCQVAPDFLCLSKGLSGGMLPLALTITTHRIFDAFLSDDRSKAFLHGHSYTANPIACSVALASLQLLAQAKQSWPIIQAVHEAGLRRLKAKFVFVTKIRVLGTIAAFDIAGFDPEHVNAYLKKVCLERGLLIRPIGISVYLLPPYCIQEAELEQAYFTLSDILQSLEDGLVSLERKQYVQSDMF